MLEKTSEKKKRSLKKNSKNSNKEVSKKLKPWERKNPWDDANDHKEIWKHENILSLKEKDYPKFTLAKNKARFYRMISWYKSKWEWLDIAPLSGTRTLLKQQKKELSDIRTHKLDYEWDLEMGTLTPSQQSYRRDEIKMCEVHEKMAISLISRIQATIRSSDHTF